jgi:hypothetical protein
MEEKGRLVLNREQRAAMVGRDGNMQVRQRLAHASQTRWRVAVKRTTLYIHPTGTALVAIYRLVRLCSPALVFCCPSCCAWVPSIVWALARPLAVAMSPIISHGQIDCRRTGAA